MALLDQSDDEYFQRFFLYESTVIQPPVKMRRLLMNPSLTHQQLFKDYTVTVNDLKATLMLLGVVPEYIIDRNTLVANIMSIVEMVRRGDDKDDPIPEDEALVIKCIKCSREHNHNQLVMHRFPKCQHHVLCETCLKKYMARQAHQQNDLSCPVQGCHIKYPYSAVTVKNTRMELPQLMHLPWERKNRVRCIHPDILRVLRDPRLNRHKIQGRINKLNILALLTLWGVHLGQKSATSEQAADMLVNLQTERPLKNTIIPVGLVCQICFVRCTKSNPIGGSYPKCGHSQICVKCFEFYRTDKPLQPFLRCPICKVENPREDLYIAVFHS